jgi:hypothetical protein
MMLRTYRENVRDAFVDGVGDPLPSRDLLV